MARFEITDIECAPLGKAPAAADTFYELGMMYSVGRSVPVDFVAAHKWFNLAAMRGNPDAGRLRRELADQMSENEVAQAQRAARAWLQGKLIGLVGNTRLAAASPQGRGDAPSPRSVAFLTTFCAVATDL